MKNKKILLSDMKKDYIDEYRAAKNLSDEERKSAWEKFANLARLDVHRAMLKKLITY